MKKMSKVASLALVSSAAFLIGCGGGSSHSSTANKTVKIKASDAYVVALPKPATLTVGGQTFTTENASNGEITFVIPANIELTDTEFDVPGDAIVDTDGDGKLSIKDQVIRMPLKTMEAGSVANPIATAALARNDMKAYKVAKTFDPVQSKKDLILNPDDAKTKALVAISDGIAFLAAEAKKTGKDPLKVVQAVNTDIVDQVVSNPNVVSTEDITNVVQQVVAPAATEAGVSAETVTKKVENVIKVIDTAAKAVKEGKIDADKALVAVVAVSDANVNPDTAVQAISNGNIEDVINNIEVSPVVVDVIKQHQEAGNAGQAAGEAGQAASEAGQAASEAGNGGYSGGYSGGGYSGGYSGGSSNTNNNANTQSNLIINNMLKVNSVDFPGANTSVAYNNGTFKAVLPADGNYSQYFNVTLNSTCSTTGTFEGNIELKVEKQNGSYVDVLIPETIICSNVGEKPVTKIAEGTTVGIATNVANVADAIGGNSVTATIDKDLKNSDLSVNLKSLESAVTTDEDKISKLEDTIGDYLEKDSNYTVTIKINGKYLAETATGTAEVNNTNENNTSTEENTTNENENSDNGASSATSGATFKTTDEASSATNGSTFVTSAASEGVVVNETIIGEVQIGNGETAVSENNTNENNTNTEENTTSENENSDNGASSATSGATF